MTKIIFLAFLPALMSLIVLTSAASTDEEQCRGLDPMPSVASYLGMELDYEIADRICCHNHVWAEPRGYLEWPEVDFFSRLDPTVETIFYDSVCGIPLFIAPRGRTFDEFREESLHHGWPSFRPEEMVSENVILHPNGRMESKCLTHLGHNLPSNGIDRYCIDLVCMAGMPIATEGNSTAPEDVTEDVEDSSATQEDVTEEAEGSRATPEDVPEGVLTAEDFDAATYTSSAEQVSGRNLDSQRNMIIGIVVAVCVVVVGLVFFFVKRARSRSQEAGKATDSPEYSDQKADDDNSGTLEGSNEGA